MKRLPILSVVQTSDLPRFVIRDERNREWTGRQFKESGGVLFADGSQAGAELQQIMRSKLPANMQPVRYVVPVFVEVFSDMPVIVNDVAMYLSQSSELQIDTPNHGNGPNNSVVLPRIEWHRIEQIKEFP